MNRRFRFTTCIALVATLGCFAPEEDFLAFPLASSEGNVGLFDLAVDAEDRPVVLGGTGATTHLQRFIDDAWTGAVELEAAITEPRLIRGADGELLVAGLLDVPYGVDEPIHVCRVEADRCRALPSLPAVDDDHWRTPPSFAFDAQGREVVAFVERGANSYRTEVLRLEGDAWSPLPLPHDLSEEEEEWLAVFGGDDGELYAVARSSWVARLLRFDAGTWTPVATPRTSSEPEEHYRVAADGTLYAFDIGSNTMTGTELQPFRARPTDADWTALSPLSFDAVYAGFDPWWMPQLDVALASGGEPVVAVEEEGGITVARLGEDGWDRLREGLSVEPARRHVSGLNVAVQDTGDVLVGWREQARRGPVSELMGAPLSAQHSFVLRVQ